MQRFRGGLVREARRLCVSLNSGLESDKEEEKKRRSPLGSRDYAETTQICDVYAAVANSGEAATAPERVSNGGRCPCTERSGKWRPNPFEKYPQERLTWGTVTSTMRRAAHSSGWARCGAGAGGCSAMKHQSLCTERVSNKGAAFIG